MLNAILLYCPFLFIDNLKLPSSISFPINMEGSRRTTTRLGHLSSSTQNKQKTKKTQPYDRKFVEQQYTALNSLWLQPVAFVAEMAQLIYLQENQGL